MTKRRKPVETREDGVLARSKDHVSRGIVVHVFTLLGIWDQMKAFTRGREDRAPIKAQDYELVVDRVVQPGTSHRSQDEGYREQGDGHTGLERLEERRGEEEGINA